MKSAVVQMASGSDKAENISAAARLSEEAIRKGAKFIVLPEVFNYRGRVIEASDLNSIKEEIPGPSMAPLMKLAKQHKAYILAGSIYETIHNSNKVYNASALINPEGKIKAIYRKIHLFDANLGQTRFRESNFFNRGTKKIIEKIAGFKIGLTICFDVRFPELYRDYAAYGANVFVVPAAFTKTTGQAHWEILLRARAIENLCYVLAPNQIGKDGRGVEAFGNSMIVSPWGEILSRASANREEIIYADLKMSVVREKRKILVGMNKSQNLKLKSFYSIGKYKTFLAAKNSSPMQQRSYDVLTFLKIIRGSKYCTDFLSNI